MWRRRKTTSKSCNNSLYTTASTQSLYLNDIMSPFVTKEGVFLRAPKALDMGFMSSKTTWRKRSIVDGERTVGVVLPMPCDQGVLGRSILFASYSRNALMPEFSSTRTYGYFLGRESRHKHYR